jgi:hypothetical protein
MKFEKASLLFLKAPVDLCKSTGAFGIIVKRILGNILDKIKTIEDSFL